MSRIKKDRTTNNVTDEAQIWQVIKTHLRTIEKLERTAQVSLEGLESRRKEYLELTEHGQSNAEESEEAQRILKDEYERLDSRFEEEYQEATKALERVEVLLAIRDEVTLDGSNKRKKRKTETGTSIASSTSPPPVIVTPSVERFASPLTASHDESATAASLVPPSIEKEKKRSNSKSNGSGTPALPPRRGTLTASSKDSALSNSLASSQIAKDGSKDSALISTTSSSSGYIDPAKARREVLAHQLPLQKGRKVAFRQPPKTKSGPGAANVSSMTSRSASSAAASSGTISGSSGAAIVPQEDEGEQWIMATIIECINNDRNRYVVVDAEDPQGPTYNTTLKAIVPLPESLHTLPPEDYKIGSQVLGLYPDTSCFYQATVRSGGPGMNGGKVTAKMQRRAEEILNMPYRLEFEDDGGLIHNVPAWFVVERP